jgi:hypothetical protein
MKMPTDKENLMESPRNTHRLGATLAMVLLAGTLGAAELASPARRTVVYSTYLGGSGDEADVAVAIDAAGNVYVAGDTLSADFPVLGPGQGQHSHSPEFPHDIFLTKFGPHGSPLWSTYTGTQWDDHLTGITFRPRGQPRARRLGGCRRGDPGVDRGLPGRRLLRRHVHPVLQPRHR